MSLSVPALVVHRTSTVPPSFDKAPYFAALVASSWSARVSVTVADGVQEESRPVKRHAPGSGLEGPQRRFRRDRLSALPPMSASSTDYGQRKRAKPPLKGTEKVRGTAPDLNV